MKSMLFVFLSAVFLCACASKMPLKEASPEDEAAELAAQDIDYFDHEKELKEGFISATQFDIPIVMNEQVEKWLDYFQNQGRKFFERWLARSGKYIPMMQAILRENGLPEDLVYLAMIESGFKPYAFSRAKAMGPWQFMKATGARYGLKVTWCLDERRDPEKSTIAAAQHLKDLNDQFKHWYLAAAGYNAGAGKISRAIQKYSTEDFWEMSKHRYLRSETKNYVPKLIAASLIAKNPEKYGFTDIQYEEPLEYDKVLVSKPTDIKSIAKAIGTDYETLKVLNPELLRWFTPPDYPNYELKIPKGKTEQFELARAQFVDVKISGTVQHRVKQGETLSHIARAYGTSIDSIMAFNNITNPRRIRAGNTLHVPVRKGVAPIREYSTPADHKIERGETLSNIAGKYGTNMDIILAANNLKNANEIKEGQVIHIPSKGAKISADSPPKGRHVLQKGETLSHVASTYGTNIRTLMAYNHIKDPKTLQIGQTLLVPQAPSRVKTAAEIDTAPYKNAAGPDGTVGYTVKRGDTLWSISRAFNVTVDEIRKWNSLKSRSMLRPGDSLVIHPRFLNGNGESLKHNPNSSAVASNNAKVHTVRKGDTIWDISREYNIPVNTILSLNNLESGTSIRPGETIKLTN